METEERKSLSRNWIIGISALALAVLALAGILFYVINGQRITAINIRLQRLVGIVNLYDQKGKEQSIIEKMRLNSGHSLTTGGESLVMVSLDDTKLLTLEELSRAEIKARKKELEFDLTEGSLFFNVNEKLKDDETFDIRTSTMVCGIRGTSALVGKDASNHEILMVTDGTVHVVATNPVTKEVTETDVSAGEMITIYLDAEAEGKATISITKTKFREEDLPALALDAIHKDKKLTDRIVKATGFSKDKLSALHKVTSSDGVSMFGEAAKELQAEGIADAIPLQGASEQIMVTVANNACDMSRGYLPLETSVAGGLRSTLDAGVNAGYAKEELIELTGKATDSVEACLNEAAAAGLGNDQLVTVADTVTLTITDAVTVLAEAKTKPSEAINVVENLGETMETAIVEAKEDGSPANVLASLNRVASVQSLEQVESKPEEQAKEQGQQASTENTQTKPQTSTGNTQNRQTQSNTGNTQSGQTQANTGDTQSGQESGAESTQGQQSTSTDNTQNQSQQQTTTDNTQNQSQQQASTDNTQNQSQQQASTDNTQSQGQQQASTDNTQSQSQTPAGNTPSGNVPSGNTPAGNTPASTGGSGSGSGSGSSGSGTGTGSSTGGSGSAGGSSGTSGGGSPSGGGSGSTSSGGSSSGSGSGTPTEYTVTVTQAAHGTVTASPSSAAKDTEITLTITPASGYELDTLTVKDATGASVSVTNRKFSMPEGNVTVTATFKEIGKVATPVITYTNGNTGDAEVSISCSTQGATINYTTQTVTSQTIFSPYSDSFTIREAKTVTAVASKTGMTDSDTVTMTFVKVTYDTGDSGSVSPAYQIVSSGSTLTAPTVTPATGTTLEGWYSNANFTAASKWIFAGTTGATPTTISSNTTLHAKWVTEAVNGYYWKLDYDSIGVSEKTFRMSPIAKEGYTYTTGVFNSLSDVPWNSVNNNVSSIIVEGNIKLASAAYLFAKMNYQKRVGFSGLDKLDTSEVTSMKYMFASSGIVNDFTVPAFDTSKVTDMSYMFSYVTSINDLKFTSAFDTSSVTDMSHMFEGCGDIGDTSRLVGLNYFDTSNVTNMQGMFNKCQFIELDLSSFNTSRVTDMAQMFKDSSRLTTIKASDDFVTTAVQNSYEMFYGCTAIKGRNNTAYDSNHTDAAYARDDLPGTPGYFTGGYVTGTSSLSSQLAQGDVVLSSSNTNNSAVTINEDLTIPEGKTLTVASGVTLTIAEGKTITLAGTIDNSGTINNYGTVTNTGNIVLNGGVFNNYSGHTINNYGTMTIAAGTTLVNGDGNGNSGTIKNHSGAEIVVNGALVNTEGEIINGISGTATITVNGTFTNSDTLTNNGTITNNGTFSNTDALTNAEGAVLNNVGRLNNSGTLTNSGTVSNAIGKKIYNDGYIINSGSINTSAIITNVGSFSNQSSGELLVLNGGNVSFYEYNATNPGTLTNSGTITVNGVFNISEGGTAINNGTITVGGVATESEYIYFDVNGTFVNNSQVVNYGQLRNYGSFTNNSDITNNGSMFNQSGCSIENANGASITNNGSAINNGTIVNEGSLNNQGTIVSRADGISGTVTGTQPEGPEEPEYPPFNPKNPGGKADPDDPIIINPKAPSYPDGGKVDPYPELIPLVFTCEDLIDWLESDDDVITLDTDLVGEEFTIDRDITVPEGKTLVIAAGVTVKVSAGITITVNGMLNNLGDIVLAETANLDIKGTFTGNQAIEATGEFNGGQTVSGAGK